MTAKVIDGKAFAANVRAQVAAHVCGQGFAQCQAQAEPLGAGGHERLEQPWQQLGRDACARVGHGQHAVVRGVRQRQHQPRSKAIGIRHRIDC